MRPSGPLPPRIYWVRRLFALAVLIVAIAILWWCVQKVTGSADDSGSTAKPSADTGTGLAGNSDSGEETPGAGQPTNSAAQEPAGGAQTNDPTKQGHKHKKKPPPIAPTGACDVAEVGMTIAVEDVKAGASTPIKLLMTGEPGTACTQAITPSTLVLRVTSGDDVVWTSDDCPDKLLAAEVVVRARPAGVYVFDWTGHRLTGSCAGTGALAKPGGYWVEAALIGADSHKAFFDVIG